MMQNATGQLCAAMIALGLSAAASAQPTAVKISQVNGTGVTQNSWAGPSANYVELHNAGASPADLTGYSLQATFSTATGGGVFPFPAGFTIPAGKYALVQLGNARTPHNDPNSPTDGQATQSPGYLISPD